MKLTFNMKVEEVIGIVKGITKIAKIETKEVADKKLISELEEMKRQYEESMRRFNDTYGKLNEEAVIKTVERIKK